MSEPKTPEDASAPPNDPPSPPAAQDTAGDEPASKDERNLAVLAHLLGIFTWFIGALIIWLMKKETSPYIDDQGKEAINFQITLGIAMIVVGLIPLVNCALVPLLWIADLVVCIMAAVAASKGERYRYPIAVRLIT